MAYLALYRAWRPQTFREVVGQEKTVAALRNAVEQDRISHAYLFAGPRGTGKTSIAKIMAKAANCRNQQAGEPCNQCLSCQDINQGNFMDVIEIDAASNRGIDEIRDLREKVRVLPAQGRKKVYIIDEVHMLTTEAFNALLKTLEEPPDSVVFILATTEPQKIPDTIRSRCQCYYFRRLRGDEIIVRLKQAAASNAIELEEEALLLIARRANGGMRDALSTLDQVYSYKGSRISREDVQDVLGLVDEAFLADFIDALLAQDIQRMMEKLDFALEQGKEAQHLARETALYLRDLMLFDAMGEKAEFRVITPAGRGRLEEQKKRIRQNQLLQGIRLLMATGEKLKFSEGNRFILEVAFLNLMDLLGSTPSEQPAAVKKATGEKSAPARTMTSGQDPDLEPLWTKILAKVKEKKIPTHALLVQGKLLGVKDDTIYIGFKKGYKFHKERMEEKNNLEILESALAEISKNSMTVQFVLLDDEKYNDIVIKKAIEYFGEDIVEIKR